MFFSRECTQFFQHSDQSFFRNPPLQSYFLYLVISLLNYHHLCLANNHFALHMIIFWARLSFWFLFLCFSFFPHDQSFSVFSQDAFAVYNNYLFIFYVFYDSHSWQSKGKPVDNIIFMRRLWRQSFYWVDFRSNLRRGKTDF